MFLKKLYHHNKLLCCIFVSFILAMAFINYKWGITATPIQQYGMYSSKQYLTDTQKLYQLYVNGQRINFAAYGLVERDLMQIPIDQYRRQGHLNDQVYVTMKAVFSKFGLGSLISEDKFINHISDLQFTHWFKGLLCKILGHAIDSLEVFEEKYVWNGELLQLIGHPQKINFIVAK